jgi:hypothetical protein
MPETPDPIAALAAKDIPTRAAGARDLGAAGEPAHVTRLLELAIKDPSPGVRLACAAAAADILARWRLPPRSAQIPASDRDAWFRVVTGADPGVNTGLFHVCAVLGLPAALGRIVVGLRDPRADVRTGAWGGLLRLCASAAVNGDAEVEGAVIGLFTDARIRPETRAEVARICSLVGYTSAASAARSLTDNPGKAIQTTATEAVQRLEFPPPVEGIWVDLGIDAGQSDPARDPVAYAALRDPSAVLWADEAGIREQDLRSVAAFRRLHMKRPGATEAGPALQIGLRTLFPADGDEIVAFGDRLLADGADDALRFVEPILPPTAASARLRGVIKLRAGDVPGAIEVLQIATEMKKVPVDTWWFLADALHRAGRDADAAPHLERYVAKAPKKAPFMAEARRRLGVGE